MSQLQGNQVEIFKACEWNPTTHKQNIIHRLQKLRLFSASLHTSIRVFR
ncbi:hypothetical protein Cal6303_3066 [Calothrix sp. PCC 6303]|nr:hypothetical protein Cal6303_3066 [Calothrix sp. PCC 6303]